MLNQNSLKLYMAFGVALLLVWFSVYFQALAHMAQVWSDSETFKHCFFIIPISLYLIYEKRVELKSVRYRPTWIVAVPLILTQILFVLADQFSIQLFAHFSAVTTLVLLLWGYLGHQAFRIILFPAMYLYFCVPFGEEFVPYLQIITADISCVLLQLVGIPVYREGLYLYLPNGTFHVAEACAGIRFLIGTFALGVLLAYLNYQYWWKRALYAVVCATLPIIANGIRAFGIMVIGYSTDMKRAVGADHLVYGWFFFLFVLILLFLLGNVGNDSVPKFTSQGICYSINKRTEVNLFLLMILIAPMLANNWLKQDQKLNVEKIEYALSQQFKTLEARSRGWMDSKDSAIKPSWSGLIDGVPIRITYRKNKRDQELVSSLHRPFNNDDFSLLSVEGEVSVGKNSYKRVVIQNVYGERKVLLIWYQLRDAAIAGPLETKWQQFLFRLQGQRTDGYYVVAEVEADKTVKEVISTLRHLALPKIIKEEQHD